MIWILVCLGVAIAAFAMWGNLNPQLPAGLRLPQSSALTAAPTKTSAASVQPVISSSSWTIARDARNLRASREFKTPIVSGENHFYPPALQLTCYDGQLYAWLETGLLAQESARTPGTVAVRVNGGPVEHWAKGEGHVVVAPNAAALTHALAKSPNLSITLDFQEAPEQTLWLSTGGFDVIDGALSTCK